MAAAERSTQKAHRAYKFRLAPNQQQLTALYQAAGAARYAYNQLTAYNLDALRRRQQYWGTRQDEGASEREIKAELRAIAREDVSYRLLGYIPYATEYLTPERRRHQDAAAQIAAGAQAHLIWGADEHFEHPWLHTASRRVLVSGLQSADKAWKNFWDSRTGARAGRLMGTPRFKKKGVSRDSFTIPAPEAMGAYGAAYLRGEPAYVRGRRTIMDYRHVRLSHLGVLRTYDSTRPLVKAVAAGAHIKSYTVSRHADRWYVSFLVELSRSPRRQASKRARAAGTVGVDLGVRYLASLSDPQAPQRLTQLDFLADTPSIKNPRWADRAARRLHRLQRALARSQKGSVRRARIRQQIARLHHKTALRRESNLHQLTKRLATGYTLIGVEDLNVAGMTASARGTVEHPGRRVAQKSGLNRVVLDAGFGVFRRQLEYKSTWYGSAVQEIDRYYPSSQICSQCQRKAKTKLSLRERVFECALCGYRADRDFNAAVNIAVQAQRVFEEKLASESGESLNGRGGGRTHKGAVVIEASRPPAGYGSGSPQVSNHLPIRT